MKWKQRLRSVTPYVFFQFLVVKPNEHQIEDVKRLANEFGIDVHFKTAQVYDYANGHPLIPEQEKYARYKRMPDGQYKVKSSLENSCWKLWHSCVLTWDGQVVPCCFDKDATHRMGDMKLEGLKDIWRGAAYRQFRQRLHQGRREIDICANCSEGTRVWEG